MRLYILFYLSLFTLPLFGQSPVADFQINAEACQTERISITNSSTNFLGSQWDFCVGDFSATPVITNNFLSSTTSSTYGLKIIKDGNSYFGFATAANSSLLRLDFGNSIANNPVVTDLGSLGILSGPEGLDIIKDGTSWVGVVGYRSNGGKLVKLVWNNLSEVPVATDLGNFGFPGRLRDVVLLKQGTDFIAVLPYFNSNTLVRINFGTSMLNNPTVANVTQSAALNGVSLPIAISVVKNSGSWNVIIGSNSTKAISVFDLGTNILSAPVEIKSQVFGSYTNLSKMKLVKEAYNYYGIVSTTSGPIHLIDFKQLKSTDTFDELPILNAPRFEGVDILKDSSQHYVYGGTTNMSKLVFKSSCNATASYLEKKTPLVSYSTPGNYPITLTAFDSEGNTSSVTKSITVTSGIAPTIAFTQGSSCISDPIRFISSTDQTITSYTWDFGDETSATGTEVSHQYITPGTYKVRLSVESDNGCGNFVERDINIYAAPVPDFSFPGNSICTNGEISFQNLTPGEYNEEDITWAWDFGDGKSASEKNPSHTYSTGGTKTVKLTASIPGCSASKSYSLTVVEGPAVNFVMDNLCFDEEVQFTNLSSGSGITNFLWNFGNGTTSTDENPKIVYDAIGAYEVSLTVQNSVGCSNTLKKTITIKALPEVNFNYLSACSGGATQFQDKSTVANGSVSSWEWDFGDGAKATEKNPTHTFNTAGNYNVKLKVTTLAGCIDSVVQIVVVNSSPVADFEVALGCPGALTHFTNTSKDPGGDGIEVNYWIINGIYHYTQNPAVLFTKSGTYTVTLAVNSGNSCKSTINRSIIIDPLPTANFTYENTCIGTSTTFVDQSIAIGDDEIVSWDWRFGEFATSTEQNPEFEFPAVGNYPVTLTVTSERGCSAIVNKTIKVVSLPEAAFAPQSNFGAPPLSVSFTNNSSGAVSYEWWFGDVENSVSVENAPTFVYTEVGDYVVTMVATNAGGCKDTAHFTISVLISVLDIALEDINIFTNTGNMQFVLTLANKGTVPITSMDINLDLGGAMSLNERFSGIVNPGESYNYPVGFEILEEDLSRVSYICANVSVTGIDLEEEELTDNSLCQDIKGLFLLTDPYPNPVNSTLHLEFFMPEDVPVSMVIVDMLGNKVLDIDLHNTKAGLNEYDYDFTTLTAGVYLVKIMHNNKSYLRRVVVQ